MDEAIVDKLKDYQRLRDEKQKYTHLWRDAFDYTFPSRGSEHNRSSSNILIDNPSEDTDKKNKMFDNVATHSCLLLATHMKSGITPQNSLWFNCIFGDQKIEFDAISKQWLHEISNICHSLIHNSNYEDIALELFQDLVVCGQSGLFQYFDEDTNKITFQYWPLWSYCADDVSVYKSWWLTKDQLHRKFKDFRFSDKINGSKPYEKHHIIQSIYQNKDYDINKPLLEYNRPYIGCWIEPNTKSLIEEDYFNSKPFINLKWTDGLPQSNYCVGPVDNVLPTIKSLNALQEILLINADMVIGGTYVATRDGVLNTNTVKFGPRQVVVVNDVNNIKPLQTGGDIGYARLMIETFHNQIREGLFANLLEPQDGPTKTATEVNIRSQLAYRMLSPILSRIGQHVSQFLVQRTIDLAETNNLLPQRPQSLVNRDIGIEYQSPVARSVKLQDLDAIMQFEQSMGQVLQIKPEVMDLYDFDQATQYKAQVLGIPSTLIRDDAAVEGIREQRAEQQQQQAMMEQANEQAQAT